MLGFLFFFVNENKKERCCQQVCGFFWSSDQQKSFLISEDQTLQARILWSLIARSTRSYLINDDQTLKNKDFIIVDHYINLKFPDQWWSDLEKQGFYNADH